MEGGEGPTITISKEEEKQDSKTARAISDTSPEKDDLTRLIGGFGAKEHNLRQRIARKVMPWVVERM